MTSTLAAINIFLLILCLSYIFLDQHFQRFNPGKKPFWNELKWHAKELTHCLRSLGLKTGFRYYTISCHCRKNPGLIEDWASECQVQALREKDPAMQASLRGWAQLLRQNLWNWEKSNATHKQQTQSDDER